MENVQLEIVLQVPSLPAERILAKPE